MFFAPRTSIIYLSTAVLGRNTLAIFAKFFKGSAMQDCKRIFPSVNLMSLLSRTQDLSLLQKGSGQTPPKLKPQRSRKLLPTLRISKYFQVSPTSIGVLLRISRRRPVPYLPLLRKISRLSGYQNVTRFSEYLRILSRLPRSSRISITKRNASLRLIVPTLSVLVCYYSIILIVSFALLPSSRRNLPPPR